MSADVSPTVPNYGSLSPGSRTLEEVYQELGLGRAQYLTWGVLMLSAFADYAEVFTISALVAYITPEWDLRLPFIVSLICTVFFCYGMVGSQSESSILVT